MSSLNMKKLTIFLGLVCLALVVAAVGAQEDSASTTPASSVLEPPSSEPAAAAAEPTEEPEEEEDDEEEAEEEEDEFMISLEDALAQFVLRHRDVRRDCQDLEIDMQIAQQSGEKADTGLQQEYMACKNYQQELEQNIMELASQISQPPASPPAAAPASAPPASSGGGFMSSITNRLPSIG